MSPMPDSESSQAGSSRASSSSRPILSRLVRQHARALQLPASAHSREFRSPLQHKIFVDDYAQRVIIPPKPIVFSAFQTLGLPEMFEEIGLRAFCEMLGPYAERIVWLFYTNLATPGRIASVDKEGVRADTYYHDSQSCGFIKNGYGPGFLRHITGTEDEEEFRKPRANELTVKRGYCTT